MNRLLEKAMNKLRSFKEIRQKKIKRDKIEDSSTFSLLQKGKGLKIRTRIVGLFFAIISVAISIVAGVTYTMSKSNLEGMTKQQLNNSVRFVSNQITLLSGAYNSKEFSGKLGYVLAQEEASFNQRGLNAKTYIINPMGFEVDRSNVNAESTNKTDLPEELVSEAFKTHNGSLYDKINEKDYCIAYGYIVEKDWLYAVAVPKASYLKPVYSLQKAVIGIGIISVIIALILSLLGTKGIIKTVKELNHVVSIADTGNMTIRANKGRGGPELADLANSFNVMLSNFQGLLKEISCTVEELAASSSQLSGIAEKTDSGIEHVHNITNKMAEGTESQKQYILKLKELTDEVMSTINIIVTRIDESTHISKDMISAVQDGIHSMTNLENKINTIEEVASGTAEQIALLENRSKAINNIVNTIKSISQQTKLLSLNASIEASRAGEFGAGFSVVAQEIQKLAQSSSQSAFEVEQLIKEIHNYTRSVSLIAQNAKDISHEGTALVKKTSGSFDTILEKVTQTHNHISSISMDATSIRINTEVFVDSVEEITQILTDTAASSQEVAAEVESYRSLSGEVASNSSQLLILANRLSQLNSKFTIQCCTQKL